MNRSTKTLVIITTLAIISTLASLGVGVTGQKTEYADRDTYISTIDPMINYGNETILRTGFNESGDLWEAYLHFDLTDKPAGTILTRLHFYVTSLDQNTNLSLWHVQNTWDESTLTVASGLPAAISFAQDLFIPITGDYTLDITSLVGTLTEISFKLNSSVNPTGNVEIYSSEYTGAGGTVNPGIVWIYEATNPTPSIHGFEMWILLGSALAGIGFTVKRLHRNRS